MAPARAARKQIYPRKYLGKSSLPSSLDCADFPKRMPLPVVQASTTHPPPMKSPARLALAVALATLVSPAAHSRAADTKAPTIQDVFNEGRAAFYRNDFATAKRLLTQVNKADPKHRPTVIMLKNIRLAEQEAAAKANSLEGRMKRTVLPRLDLVDARVPEVLEFIQIKASEVTKGGAKPNFVIRLTDEDQKRPVTLHLSQPTLHTALAALSTVADLDIVYDQYAVTIRSRSLAPATPAAPAATPAAEGGGPPKK